MSLAGVCVRVVMVLRFRKVNRRRGKRGLAAALGRHASRERSWMVREMDMKEIETSVLRFSGRLKRVSRQWLVRSVLVSLLSWLGGPTPAAAQSQSRSRGELRVMTYNVNEGTDFLQIQAATDLNSFLVAVGQTITQVRETNPPARMRTVAKEIIGQFARARRVVHRALLPLDGDVRYSNPRIWDAR